MEEINSIQPNIKDVKQALTFFDEITGITPIRDMLAVSTKHELYFLKYNEGVDLYQLIHGMTEQLNNRGVQ